MENLVDAVPQILTKKETAQFCKVSVATINRWMKIGKLSYLKLGRKVLFSQTQVIQDLEKFKIAN